MDGKRDDSWLSPCLTKSKNLLDFIQLHWVTLTNKTIHNIAYYKMRKNHNIVYSLCSLQLQHVIPYTHIISDHIISSDMT